MIMRRTTILEKIKTRDVNITKEADKIKFFFVKSIMHDANILFPFVKEKLGCLDSKEYNDLLDANISHASDLDAYLDYCDIFLIYYDAYQKLSNKILLYPDVSLLVDYNATYESIEYTLDKLNYKIVKEKNKELIIVFKDAAADLVVKMPAYKHIKWRIIEFNHHKLSLEDKKSILMELYKIFEKIREELKKTNKDLEATIGEMSQLLRHHTDDKKRNKYHFYFKNEEYWCNRLYSLFLEAFINNENKKIIIAYKSLKKETNGT